MNDEQLRAALRALDPARRLPVAPLPAEHLEQAMSSTPTTSTPTNPSTAPTAATAPPWWRRPALVTAAAAVALAAGVGGLAATRGDAPAPRPPARAATTLALTVPSGLSSSSCVPFDVAILRDMPVALRGTVVEVTSAQVTLDVQRWYKGGTAERVTVAQPDPNTSVALDGVTFEPGRDYLLTATDGVVNGCGYSGPATPELERSYQQAFGG